MTRRGTGTAAPAARPARHRRRWLAPVLLVLLLALLGVGLVVADGVAEEAFEEQAARRVQASLGTPDPPLVDATGDPFLPQLLRGDVDHLTVHSGRTTLTGTDPGADPLTVERLDLRVEQLRSSDRFATTTAGRLEGTAVVGYPEIGRLAGRAITPGEATDAGTRWTIAIRTEVFGVEVPVQVSGLPVLDGPSGRQLTLTDVRLSVADYDIPRAVADRILATVVRPVPLELPLGLGADAIRSGADGLTVQFSGQDVPLS